MKKHIVYSISILFLLTTIVNLSSCKKETEISFTDNELIFGKWLVDSLTWTRTIEGKESTSGLVEFADGTYYQYNSDGTFEEYDSHQEIQILNGNYTFRDDIITLTIVLNELTDNMVIPVKKITGTELVMQFVDNESQNGETIILNKLMYCHKEK